MQPNVVNLRYFKLYTLLHQITDFENQIFIPTVCKNIETIKFEFVGYTQFFDWSDHMLEIQNNFIREIDFIYVKIFLFPNVSVL